MVGQQATRLNVQVGSIWGGGYSVDVSPEEYVVVEHESCPDAKASGPVEGAKGLCVIRISKEQSDRFMEAMARFKNHAVPLQTFSLDDPYLRPDGKPCRNDTTDLRLISLQWTGTDGVKIATFYEGCDQEELKDYYKSVLAVTDALPIQQIIGKH